MINIKSGSITINGKNFVIRRGLTKDEFIKSTLFGEVLNQQVYSFTNYYLKPQLIGKDNFILVLYFNPNNIIDSVDLSLSRDENIPSWNNWSEGEELKKKDEHDKWLERKIGKPPYKYSWGEISSNYDPRSGSSMITIRYSV